MSCKTPYLLMFTSLLVIMAVAVQAAPGATVPLGHDRLGRTVYLAVIPLDYMDARLAALLFGGTYIDQSTNTHNQGNWKGSNYQKENATGWGRNNGSNQEYGGYWGGTRSGTTNNIWPGNRR